MMIGIVSHGLGAAGNLVLLVLIALGWRRSGPGIWLVCATGAMVVWSLAELANAALGGDLQGTAGLLELVRSAAWIGLLASVLIAMGLDRGRSRVLRTTVLIGVVAGVATFALGLAEIQGWTAWTAESGATWRAIGHITLAVIGLALVENLFRPVDEVARWRVKFLCFGLGGLFAYDLLVHAHTLLFRDLDANLAASRGLVSLMIVPFIAVAAARNTEWEIDIGVSRASVFHSTALVGAGVYLIGMAAGGYYIREFGGDWGSTLWPVFLFGTVALLVVLLASARFRSRLRVFISKHFFSYKYDYREIWLRFIATMTAVVPGERLEDRVVRAVADVVDSPDGLLWTADQDRVYRPAATWNTSRWVLPAAHDLVMRHDDPLVEFLAREGKVVVIDEIDGNAELYGALRAPTWLATSDRAWIVVPLSVAGGLVGFIVLGRPRAPRDLNWEDFDLLRTIGRQAASYVSEQNVTRALAEAREFESFTRRFAFVVHDVKNLASQLTLLAGNVTKHGHDPAFREDMAATMQEAIGKLNRLLARMREADEQEHSRVPLAPLLRNVIARWSMGATPVALDAEGCETLTGAFDVEQVRTVIGHLVQNAVDAVADSHGAVRVRLRQRDDAALVEVIDDGPGMTAEFVRDQLFRPFQSTKSGGYGIGVYESRALIQGMNGTLDVVTAPGKGTTMRIVLPLNGAARPSAA